MPVRWLSTANGGHYYVRLGRLLPLEKGRLGSLALFFTDVVSLVLLH